MRSAIQLAALRLQQVHEVRADGAAINGARCVGIGTGKIEVGIFSGFEKTERIEIGFEVAPAAESFKDAFAIGGRGQSHRRRAWRTLGISRGVRLREWFWVP